MTLPGPSTQSVEIPMLKLAARPIAVPAIMILVALVAAGLVPQGAAKAGSQVQPKRYVTGWLPYWNPDAATKSVKDNAGVFDDASPFVFNTISTRRIDLELSTD